MRSLPVGEVARIVGGRLRPGAEATTPVANVVVDSREAGPGTLFVALAGSRDGHLFVEDALGRGATAALVATGWAGRAATSSSGWETHRTGGVIEVEDPARALMTLASEERSGLAATVIGVTGSTGKTCTKDFIAAVLSTRFQVVASPASYNNEVGLPLTVVSADVRTEALVCEMGARGIGHLRLLCEIARPHVGVVTNVGVAHMELFGSVENIREAKAELVESLPGDGTAVLNADDPVVLGYAARTRARPLFFGRDGDVRASDVSVDPSTGRASFRLTTPNGSGAVTLPVAGEHMVWNALAAGAVGHAMGLSADEVVTGLARARVQRGRMETSVAQAGFRVIDDTYNANPTSMAGALKAARGMAGEGRLIAVLGHMAELGPIAGDEHERLGELLARLGIHTLVSVGTQARGIAAGAVREGMEPERVLACEDADDAVAAVRRIARPGDLVLVKGSRVARLERVAQALRSGAGARNVAAV